MMEAILIVVLKTEITVLFFSGKYIYIFYGARSFAPLSENNFNKIFPIYVIYFR